MHSSIHVIDYVVLVCYLLLMAGIGAYFMRFMQVGADFLKGGNRVEWSGGWPACPLSCLAFQFGHSPVVPVLPIEKELLVSF